MKLSDKQAMILLLILRETLSIANLGGYSTKQRKDLFDDIVNQQSIILVDLEERKDESGNS